MSINKKTFITKTNTIVKDSYVNLSLNPVMELNYGRMNTRCLIYFDHTKLKEMVEDKTYPDMSKLRHVLKFTNAASINEHLNHCILMDSEYNEHKQRATSFDLIFFLIPEYWDNGKGFDYVQDLTNISNRGVSSHGCNWYQFKDYCKWEEEGIYGTRTLSKELDAFTSLKGNLSDIIIGYQHFEYGNEPICLDITETVNKYITGELCNHGIGIAFSPKFEETETKLTQYVGFFTPYTNSFFQPYVETTYDDYISDDRIDFYLDKPNKLYFYVNIGGKSVNLDEMPVVEVDGETYTAKQTTKGAYYIEIELPSDKYEEETMVYDNWSNLVYKGKKLPDTELSFVVKSPKGYYSLGLPSEKTDNKFIPSLYGIEFKEKIRRGDIRKVNVECRIPYTSNQMYPVDSIEYRLYTKEGEMEIDVIEYSNVEKMYNANYFLINTNDLVPSRYYIDVKIKYDFEEIIHRNILEFDIMDDITNRFN